MDITQISWLCNNETFTRYQSMSSAFDITLICMCITVRLYQKMQSCNKINVKNSKEQKEKSASTLVYVNKSINNRQFWRMFWMYSECIALLCDKIKSAVGKSKFKSEEYICAFLSYPGHI